MVQSEQRADARQALQDTMSAAVAVGLLSDTKPYKERVKALERAANAL